MKEKANKDILNRIDILENKFPKMNFNIQEYVKELINILECILGYEIKERIQLPDYKYINEDTLDREIFSFLTVEELRILIYGIIENKKN